MNSDKTAGLTRMFWYLLVVVSVSMIAYHLWYILSLPYEPQVHSIFHLGFALSVLLLISLKDKLSFLHLLMFVVSLAVTLYFISNYDEILSNPSYPPVPALIAGILAALVVFYMTYEVFGLVFPGLTAIGVLYMAFGSQLPRWIRAPECDWDRLITLLSSDVTSPWGIYGNLLILSANYLFLFIFFGAALEAFGGLRFIKTVGFLLASKFRSGAAALSIFTSAFLGSVTGSTVANITITGSFTIPLMKNSGYKAEQAAAIETAASSGGQILPPIMGATVFLMAGYTGIPYIDVVKASFIPAIMYFAVLLLYAELNAKKLDIKPLPPQKINKADLLWDAPIFLVPLTLLMILLINGFSLMRTILWCLACVSILGTICSQRKSAQLEWREVGSRLMNGIVSGSQIAVVLALIGVLVATVEVTGLGMKLGNILVAVGAQKMFFLLLLTMLTGLILGVGLPTPAAYIICATILSPAMIKLGVPLLQAHLFPLYFAVFSHLTPPVGIGLMVACKMAESDYIGSALEGIKAASSSFLLPFFFIYTPAILLQWAGGMSEVILHFLVVILSFLGLTILLNGFCLSKLSLLERSLILLAVIVLLICAFGHQSYANLAIGGALLFGGIYMNIRSSKYQGVPTLKRGEN